MTDINLFLRRSSKRQQFGDFTDILMMQNMMNGFMDPSMYPMDPGMTYSNYFIFLFLGFIL